MRVPEFDRSTCRAIVRSLPQAVVLLDAKFRIALANRAASALLQLAPERLRGADAGALVPDADLRAVLSDGGTRRARVIESRLAAPSGARTIKINAVPLTLWDCSKQSFWLLLIDDLSDTAVLEQQLIESEKRAAMGQLAAGILHEVANPLTSLGSNLVFVRGRLHGVADPAVLQALDVSLQQLEEMRQMLGTLSGFPARTTPRYELVDLQDVLRTSVMFIAKEAERRGVEVTAAFDAPLLCEIDVRLLKQVVLNLLNNAMDAMPHGGRIDIRTCRRPASSGEPPALVIQIADTGVGIAEADLRKVFRPLFSTKPRGAGLGLSFCRQAIEEQGGEIRLTSCGRNRGAVATISLPVRQAAFA
jgi:signal transduction histidine kinase